jgi:hypothetical protein
MDGENKEFDALSNRGQKLLEIANKYSSELSELAWEGITQETSKFFEEITIHELSILMITFLGHFSSKIILNVKNNIDKNNSSIKKEQLIQSFLELINKINREDK